MERNVTAAEPLLRVENLVKHYRAKRGRRRGRAGEVVHAVDGVSLQLQPGETLGIVGESGCGKSTLARTLVRLTEPTSGHAWFDGDDIFALPRGELRAVRRHIQMIFQDPYSSVNPRLTIEQIVAEAWDGHPELRPPENSRRAHIGALLERVGLDGDMLDRRPREFSGGQLQRVGIARALAVAPRLIICDEPVSALDVSIQAQVINLLKELQRDRNVAYLFISHDLAVVRHVASRIAVMYLGKVVEAGPAAEICDNPTHPYTQALLAAGHGERRSGMARRVRMHGELPDPTRPPSGCRFRTRCWKAQSICAESEPALEQRVLPGTVSACHFAEPIAALPVRNAAAPANESHARC
jgi:oligopeptide transport system ATP-binding protein